ncbi:MAG: PfkB family carbohydrate kinase, partial [Propionibacteriaceae bacterium]|nr:PfkB family carbohydrate kinase [Propionibacteriaceae bacterium]
MTNAHGDGPWLGVIGDIVEDVVVFATAPFAAASDTPARIVRRRGGSAANVAVAASSLVTTRFIGCVGDDPTGRQLAKTMPGVDVRLQITHQPTGTIVVLVDAAGERHMFPDRGANVHMGALAPGWLDGLFALHATAYSLETGSTADVVMAAFRQANLGVTSLDASSHALIRQIGVESFVGLVEQADPVIVFANADEAALLGWDVQQPSPQRVVIVK